MSEERFSVGIRKKDNEVFYSFFDGDNPIDLDNIVDLLNELSDENEKLRFLIDINSGSERKKLERQVDEQQAIINEQNEAIDYLKTVIRYTLPNQMVADVFKQIGEEYE